MEPADVCASHELIEGQLKHAQVNGRDLVLLRHAGIAYALDGLCPHRGGELWRGDSGERPAGLPAPRVDLRRANGGRLLPPGTKLPTHRVVEEAGRVKVQLSVADLSGFTPPNF
ncbi:MAG: Rieske 2Fe-2S domain-containing protein [Myxococcaceae bacterium]